MNRIEDRLRDAFGAAAETVRPESVSLLRQGSRSARTRRLAPLAAAAAVAFVIIAAAVITPLALAGSHGEPSRPAGPAAPSSTAPASPPGATLLVVPDVVGMQAAQANAVLSAAGLRVTVNARGRGARVLCSFSGAGYPCDRAVADGTVQAEAPAAGTRLQTGAQVMVLVDVTGTLPSSTATGSPSAATVTTVPDVAGLAQAQASAILSSLGFNVTTVSGTSSSQPPGSVMAQNPAAGSRLTRGAMITLTIVANPA